MYGGVNYLSESGDSAFLSWILGFLIIAAAVFLLIGFLTPLIALIALAGGILSLADERQLVVVEIYAVILAAAIALLGPGAFSLDARLFGRREIVIPKDKKQG